MPEDKELSEKVATSAVLSQAIGNSRWKSFIGMSYPYSAWALALIATISFVLGILVPFCGLEPSLGDPLLTAIVEYLSGDQFDPHSYSVLGGIVLLFQDGDVVIALVLLLFSVLFPAVKLTLIWQLLLYASTRRRRAIRMLEKLGPWSMADVFVVSVTILAFKSFPAGTRFTVGWGYYLFLLSVVCAMLTLMLISRMRPRPFLHAARSG
jgi:paraquat-inducible protein A